MPTRPSLLLLAVLSLSACGGGGGGGGGASSSETRVAFSLGWGARSRAIDGPGSALSARVVLASVETGQVALAQYKDRRSDPAAYTAAYTTTGSVRPGAYRLNVAFYSGAGGAGAVVAQGSADVAIAKDGSGIGTVATEGVVRSVAVAPQSVVLGASGALAFTARDAQGNVLALSPGSATWSQTGGDAATVGADGAVATKALGVVAAKATVDGVSSGPAELTVLPAAVAVEKDQVVPYGGTRRLVCNVTDAKGRKVAVPEGLAQWQKTGDGGFFTLAADGLATAVHAGSEGVRVSVLGVESALAAVAVSAAPVVSVSIAAGQTLRLGETKALAFSAKDAEGKDVTSLVRVAWSVVSGDAFLAFGSNGTATGRKAGVATVRLAAGGITSDPATVEVLNAGVRQFDNPGFESGLDGWTTTGSFENYPIGHTGSKSVRLGDSYHLDESSHFLPGAIRQSVPGLTPGARYRVSYWTKGSYSGPLTITANGKTISTSGRANNPEWVQYRSDEFVADASEVTFEFAVLSAARVSPIVIDDVALEPVP